MLLFAGSDRGDGTGRDERRGRVGFEAVVVVFVLYAVFMGLSYGGRWKVVRSTRVFRASFARGIYSIAVYS
jgi:hypothetical protein